MWTFKIEIWQDHSYAKKNFPKIPFTFIYLPTTKNVYLALTSLMKIKLKKFEPIKKGNKTIVTQSFDNKDEADKELKNLQNFLHGGMNEFKAKEQVQKVLANRTIMGLIKKHKDNLISKLTGNGEVLNFLAKCSIYIKYSVQETKDLNR